MSISPISCSASPQKRKEEGGRGKYVIDIFILRTCNIGDQLLIAADEVQARILNELNSIKLIISKEIACVFFFF